MHPIARCTIPVRMRPLPCRSVPVWTQSHCSAVPPRSEATRCTAVSPRWKAARRLNVPALYGHKLVALLYRFCSHILHCPAASLADHPLTSYPPVWVQPRSPPLCNSIRMRPLPRYAAAAHRQHPLPCHTEIALLWRPCSNIPRCSSMPHDSKATPLPPFGYDIVFPAVRPAPDAPYCTAMPPMRGNTLVTRPYPLFKSNPVARCPSLAGDLPRRPAVPPRSGGTAGRRLLFARLISRPKRPERVVFLFLLGRFFYGSS